MIVERQKDGLIHFHPIDFEIFIGDFFEECKDEHETEWLKRELIDCIEIMADEKLDELESGDE